MSGKQIIQSFLIILLLIFFVWLAFYFLVFALILGIGATAFLVVRKFLIDKGIITPSPEVTAPPADPAEPANVEIIEVEYREVNDPEKKV